MDEIQNTQEMNETPVKRGGCLTVFLILMFIANSLTSLMYFFSSNSFKSVIKSSQSWAIPLLGVLGLLNVLCAFGVWKWKKIGVYGIAVTTLSSLVINLVIGIPIATALMGLIGLVIIIALIRPLWKHFN